MKIKLITLIILLSSSLIVTGEIQDDGFNDPDNQIQGGNTYTIRKHTISSGGGVITGGDFTLTSSIGQIDAGHNATNGGFTLRGGFLQQNTDLIFRNGFE